MQNTRELELKNCIFALFEHYPNMYDAKIPISLREFDKRVNRMYLYHRDKVDEDPRSLVIMRGVINCYPEYIYDLYVELFDEFQIIKTHLLSEAKKYFDREMYWS